LEHHGVIESIAVFLDEESFYLLMERGHFDLGQMLKRCGRCDEPKVKRIAFHLFEAVAHLHSKNVVHRDLKPQNIVFSKEQPTAPKLIDFGDAEIVENDQSYTDFIGTPWYMAPEKLGPHKGWQLKKADVWAVAAIAFEMFCGERCFGGNAQREIFGNILSGQWSWPQSRRPSTEMMDAIGQCLSNNPKDRPSAEEQLGHRWFVDIEVNSTSGKPPPAEPASAEAPSDDEGDAPTETGHDLYFGDVK